MLAVLVLAFAVLSVFVPLVFDLLPPPAALAITPITISAKMTVITLWRANQLFFPSLLAIYMYSFVVLNTHY
jgi:hypothetical protein